VPHRPGNLAAAPSVDEVRSICRTENDIVRNLRITECYHRLSVAFRDRVGLGANWCTFATWASRQAGCTIRGEDLIDHLIRPTTPRLWRAVLRAGVLDPRTAAGWIVRHVHTPFDAVENASQAVAVGNLKVFEEIGEVFAHWLADERHVPEAPLLREAFANYAEAAVTQDVDKKARLMLFGNIQCGLHEQTRLQPQIEGAMLAPLSIFPFLRPLLKDAVCHIVTHGFMTLKLPGGRRLALARELDAPVPQCFNGVDGDPLLRQFEHAGEGGEGAENWADLQQRMRYIALLFRCYHFDNSLFEPPLNDRQREAMMAGKLPRGIL
jgi:hypothetical protein